MSLVSDQHNSGRPCRPLNHLRATLRREIDEGDGERPAHSAGFRLLKTEPPTDMAPRKSENRPIRDEQRCPRTIDLIPVHRHKIPLRVLPSVISPGIVAHMDAPETTEGFHSYEPPTITRVGSLSELTQFGKRPNFSDARPGLDDAESNESG